VFELAFPVRLRVARRAERDQIQFGIGAGVTAEPLVVNFEIRHRRGPGGFEY